jgi:hypothetical protein
VASADSGSAGAGAGTASAEPVRLPLTVNTIHSVRGPASTNGLSSPKSNPTSRRNSAIRSLAAACMPSLSFRLPLSLVV